MKKNDEVKPVIKSPPFVFRKIEGVKIPLHFSVFTKLQKFRSIFALRNFMIARAGTKKTCAGVQKLFFGFRKIAG